MRGESTDDDEKLWALARKGDPNARNALLVGLRDLLRRFFANKAGIARARLGDCTIEQLAELFDELDPAISLRVHALRIAVAVLCRFRAATDAITYDKGICELVLGSDATSADGSERRAIEALRALPLEHQIVFELYFCEGLGHDEIAQILEVPVNTVRSRIMRGRQRLTERLSGDARAGQ
jgi:RNA polymerase sigma factor (sigma-70 family)